MDRCGSPQPRLAWLREARIVSARRLSQATEGVLRVLDKDKGPGTPGRDGPSHSVAADGEMMSDMSDRSGEQAKPSDSGAAQRPLRSLHSRRDVIRSGAKLAWIVPALLTFTAQEAYAQGSNYSCYPTGHACGGAALEDCCGAACDAGVCP